MSFWNAPNSLHFQYTIIIFYNFDAEFHQFNVLSENSFKKTLEFKVGILGGGLMSSNYYILWLDGVKNVKDRASIKYIKACFLKEIGIL